MRCPDCGRQLDENLECPRCGDAFNLHVEKIKRRLKAWSDEREERRAKDV
jgi:ABC-type ATPase with predicted acetyltransferase domain